MKDTILNAYVSYILEHEKPPVSVYSFCKKNKIKEKDFFDHFSDFDAVSGSLLASWLEKTIENVKKQPEYEGYGSREKVLLLFYTWVETLAEQRSYMLRAFKNMNFEKFKNMPLVLKNLRREFKDYTGFLFLEGISKGDIPDRKFISKGYSEGLWLNFLYITHYWLRDSSAGSENTDEAIEKSTNLYMDMVSRNSMDSVFEFGKFMFTKGL